MDSNSSTLPLSFLQQLPYLAQVELPTLSTELQHAFFAQYMQRRKSMGFAYLLWVLFGLHYAYVNKWAVQFVFWITGGGLGVWWIIDLFRMPGIIRRYNDAWALECLANIKMVHRS
ncbi:TM2 domain-containing protein [Rufibacter glacialis]|uniref:TM2 domain-containing protein n=1 Tax=Rufibacter glacialis TaxID=1259555 RepID=A0A5M8QBV0_9BACT|nr:TM2 domain-containing protein [Rufibacter glacialis]KAA6432360.1 TM2 domain-containing protein [Rufibacter glacialis]